MNKDFTATMLVDKTPEEVFNAINNVSGWWSQDFHGHSQKLNDEFTVQFADMHFTRHLVTELVPGKKIVWLVTESNLSFIKDVEEWKGTENIFEIAKEGDKTRINFTHKGLVPEVECYNDCNKGWNYFLNESLVPYINTGKGHPDLPASMDKVTATR